MTPNSKASPAYGIRVRSVLPTVEIHLDDGNEKERWRELCEQAASEYDPQKLHELVAEVDRLLEERELRLLQRSISGTDSAG